MTIDKLGKAAVSAPAAATKALFPGWPGREEEAQKLSLATIKALETQFRRFDVVLLVDTSIRTAGEDGFGFSSWARMLDRVIYYMRLGTRDFGVALCEAAERAVITQAKQMQLVASDYQPRPRD